MPSPPKRVRVTVKNRDLTHGACLPGHLDFRLADFSGQDLRGRKFTRCDLRGASFADADCSGVDFSHSNLQRADLRRAVLRDTDFRGADLSQANLSEAREASMRIDLSTNLHKTAGLRTKQEPNQVARWSDERFAAALYDQMGRQRSPLVSLSEMRQAMGCTASDFERGLRRLRERDSNFVLETFDGRHGSLSDAQQAAAIREGGQRYVYVTARQTRFDWERQRQPKPPALRAYGR